MLSIARATRAAAPLARAAARPAPAHPAQTRALASRKHKKFIKLAKGYRGRANRCFRIAVQRVEKAWQYAYRDRKVRHPTARPRAPSLPFPPGGGFSSAPRDAALPPRDRR